MPKPQTTARQASPTTPCSVSSTRREVIENKLLTALDDEWKVAILATESDLKTLIKALEYYDMDSKTYAECQDMAADCRQLLEAASPQNA